jgi:kynurenine formamidase
MKMDLSYPVTKELLERFLAMTATGKDSEKFGHVGTHFDVIDKTFSLANCQRQGRIFDVRSIESEVGLTDVDVSVITENDFVFFLTGVMAKNDYGSAEYFACNKSLSFDLINCLIDKKISLLGVDMKGVRHTSEEHSKADHLCADCGIFIIENLYNLDKLYDQTSSKTFIAHTYPMQLIGASGLPTRVIAEL